MNALVDYGSSSDEESIQSRQEQMEIHEEPMISKENDQEQPLENDGDDEGVDFEDRRRSTHLQIGSQSRLPDTHDANDETDPQSILLHEIKTHFLKEGILTRDVERNENASRDAEVEFMIQERLRKFLALRRTGTFLNPRLENMHDFKNPSIMTKMIEYLGLSHTEHGTNAPSGAFDAHGLHKKTFQALMNKSEQKDQAPTAAVKTNASVNPSVSSSTSQMDLSQAIALAKERAAKFTKGAR